MASTTGDAALAKQASDLLAERGRADLSVTSIQVMKWRQSTYGPLPVLGDRRGGRGRQTVFADGAARVAAEIAVALDEYRNLDVAVLTAFSLGAPVSAYAVWEAYDRYLGGMQLSMHESWRMRHLPRSRVPKRLRLVIPGHRDASGSVSEELLALLLGEQTGSVEGERLAALERLLDATAPDLSTSDDERVRLEGIVSGLSLAALRRVLMTPNVEELISELANSVAQIRVLMTYHETLSAVLLATGTRASVLPDPLNTLLSLPLAGPAVLGGAPTPGASVALLGLILYAHAATSEERRTQDATVQAAAAEIPRNRAMLMLIESLPEAWRPAFSPAPGRAQLFLAELPVSEQSQLAEAVRKWMREHPTGATQLAAIHEELDLIG